VPIEACTGLAGVAVKPCHVRPTLLLIVSIVQTPTNPPKAATKN
jgi:hypothetical protein